MLKDLFQVGRGVYATFLQDNYGVESSIAIRRILAGEPISSLSDAELKALRRAVHVTEDYHLAVLLSLEWESRMVSTLIEYIRALIGDSAFFKVWLSLHLPMLLEPSGLAPPRLTSARDLYPQIQPNAAPYLIAA